MYKITYTHVGTSPTSAKDEKTISPVVTQSSPVPPSIVSRERTSERFYHTTPERFPLDTFRLVQRPLTRIVCKSTTLQCGKFVFLVYLAAPSPPDPIHRTRASYSGRTRNRTLGFRTSIRGTRHDRKFLATMR